MDRVKLKKETKEQLKGNWKMPVLLTLAYLIISIILSVIKDKNLFLSLIIFLIYSWAFIAIPKFYLEFLKKNGKVSFKDILVPKNKFLKALGFQIILGIISFVIIFITTFSIIFLIMRYISDYNTVNIFGMIIATIFIILILVAYIIFNYMISQIPYIIIEKDNIKLIDSVKLSSKLMKGNKWKYFVLQLSFIGLIILSILTLGIGFLWLIPYISLTLTNFYKGLTEIENTK